MRLIQVQVDGYKRLRDASTFVNGRLLAFVGPNEAGKSSMLEALALLHSTEPIPGPRRARAGEPVPDDKVVVRARFRLAEHEQKALGELELVAVPRFLTITRTAGGSRAYLFDPVPERTPDRRVAGRSALERIEHDLRQAWPAQGDEAEPSSVLVDGTEHAGAALGMLDEDRPRDIDWATLLSSLEAVPATPTIEQQLPAVRALAAEAQGNTAGRDCIDTIEPFVPRVLLFDSSERDLRTEYGLRDTDIAEARPPALSNLLDLAGLNYHELVAVLDDRSRRETMLQRANSRLKTLFSTRWKQSKVSVQLNTNGPTLEILIHDEDANSTSALDERSDGLRTFVALTAFVGADADTPPILLIDEAETHLHYNAQADLINMLTRQQIASQVLYTTHSPGCLPRDLGRGVRFVEPARDKETSIVRHDFWAYEDNVTEGGFSPLLFVMGAGAAAFASLRFAVIGEGPTEMLLLPSLIRAATGSDELEYQVAPGISTLAHSGFPALGVIAAKACYLVDGDKGGSKLKAHLVHQKVSADRVFSLPSGTSIEDLIEPAQYLRAVADLLGASGPEIVATIAPAVGTSIRATVKARCRRAAVPPPGPVAVAEHLLGTDEAIRVTPEAAEVLTELHAAFLSVFDLDDGTTT